MSILTTEFTLNDCTLVHSLAPNKPIFQLDLINGSLVLKAENSGTRSELKNNTTIMRFVDAHSKAVPVSPREIMVLSRLAHLMNEQQLSTDLGRYPIWEKMELKNDILDLRVAMENRTKQVNPDKTGIRKFATVLTSPGGLEKLGAIVAADCFNGNGDRFILYPWYGNGADASANYGEGFGNGQNRVKLKCLINIGNVFVAANKAGDANELLGLDMFDPNSQFNDWSVPLATSEQIDQCGWPGRVLIPGEAVNRQSFAEAIVNDLELVLGPRNRSKLKFWASKDRLGPNASARIRTGIEAGAARIRHKMLNGRVPKDPHAAQKQGLMDRLQILGWI